MEAAIDEALGPIEYAHTALIVVDFQEDFCPPHGSLAVPDGRAIAPVVNTLLGRPFAVRVATQDWHPAGHVSFASSHAAGVAFESVVSVTNPHNAAETQSVRLWPDHCVAESHGAALVPELNIERVTHTVKKGTDSRVEMFSAFRDSFVSPCVARSELGDVLQEHGIKAVVVVGLAFDFCVRDTAMHAAQDGYVTTILKDGTRAVFNDADSLEKLHKTLADASVRTR